MPADEPDERALVRELRGLACVRSRCAELLALAEAGRALHFEVDEARFADVVAAIVEASTALSASPDERFGRLRHFDVGGVARTSALAARLSAADPVERARSYVDLVVPSVLLDAGAGMSWGYVDTDGTRHTRSEGLAIASLRLFEAGAFGGSREAPRCDAEGLEALDVEKLGSGLQARPGNTLVGLEGRARTLSLLAAILRGRPELFGAEARAGRLVDAVLAVSEHGRVETRELFAWLAGALAPLWPAGETLAGEPLGDVWRHPELGEGADGLVPLHKLVQWLLRSLVEPLATAGVELVGLEQLTPLADYRNAGLLVDLGALRLREPSEAERPAPVSGELVVEWRALSVALLDRLASRLDASPAHAALRRPGAFDTAAWLAGRTIAARLRDGAPPPIVVASDGTVF